MKVGAMLSPFVIEEVTPSAILEWAEFLGDPNPIHLDPAAVAAMGLGHHVINQGPANLAYVINLLASNFPLSKIVTLQTRFLNNVFADDRAVAQGRITEIDGARMTCELWLEVEDRGRVIECTAVIENPTSYMAEN